MSLGGPLKTPPFSPATGTWPRSLRNPYSPTLGTWCQGATHLKRFSAHESAAQLQYRLKVGISHSSTMELPRRGYQGKRGYA
jgi:hypothetical protein